MNILFRIDNKVNRKWYHIIGWWEIRRLPYNIILGLAGFLSFRIAYISIPLIYILIGLALNGLYILMWIIDISMSMLNDSWGLKRTQSKKLFLIYFGISVIIVFGIAILIAARF